MPIYEYVCQKCCHEFEQLVLRSDDPPPECPQCRSGDVVRRMSAASVRAHGIAKGSGGYTPPACRPSGG